MGVLIAIEGICCSGKTTMTQLLAERLTLKGYNSIYNHGAMTYTPVGREFYEITANKNFGITTSFYLIDLIINIQTYIRPLIEKNSRNVVLQDRYFDSITTYANAYGTYSGEDCNIYRIPDVLLKANIAMNAQLKVFCAPPYDVIEQRMTNSKDSKVHSFYRNHPDFLQIAYDELLHVAKNTEGGIIVDTSNNDSIENALYAILLRIDSCQSSDAVNYE